MSRQSDAMKGSEARAHFRSFASSLEQQLKNYPLEDEETSMERQKRQVEDLFDAEARFKQTLLDSPFGEEVFERFITFICDERRNILDARKYFRERQVRFVAEISPNLKTRNWKGLSQFRYNYSFIKFAVEYLNGRVPELDTIFAEVAKKRNELVEVNLPLAISRSRIFVGRTPKSHLTIMDFIQSASEGLLTAVDKFTPPYTPAFRSTAMGRMHGNFIEDYSETSLHFFPVDRRKLYRANKEIGRLGGIRSVDFEALAAAVNKDAEPAEYTNAAEIADLLFAASTVAIRPPFEEGGETSGNTVSLDESGIVANESFQPDVQYEKAQVDKVLQDSIATLTCFEKKFLAMKGVAV